MPVRGQKKETSKLVRYLNLSMWFLAGIALMSVIIQYGFYLDNGQRRLAHRIDLVIITVFILETFLRLFFAVDRAQHMRRHLVDFLLILFFISIYFFLGKILPLPINMAIILGQAYLLGSIVLRTLRLNQVLLEWRVSPPKMVVYSFLLAIMLGALLLSLPKSTPEGNRIRVIDALFTATSAVCVTGLIVVDTATDFSTSGQMIILAMIQMGGLGIMTFSAAFALFTGLGLGLKERSVLQDVMKTRELGSIGTIVTLILIVTFSFEFIGVLLMLPTFVPEMGMSKGFFFSIFHSISSFCNAGFSLFSTNLEGYYGTHSLTIVVMALVVFGGLGFPVLIELFSFSVWQNPQRRLWRRFSVHTRIVLLTSSILIVIGTVFIYFNTRPGDTVGWTGFDKVMASLFQSITTRTAGFNTVRIASFGPSVLLMMIWLMFIGASPGSTGGGVKTTTFALLFLKIRSQMKGQDHTEVWSRRITSKWVESAAMVLFLAIGVISASVVILSITETASLMDILFEEVSAFSTVGLSTGLTPNLTDIGKLVIIASMFIGRIGPITLLLSLAQQRRRATYDLPEEPLLIG